MRQEQEMRMVTSVLRTFANTIAELAEILEPPRVAAVKKWTPVGETAIEDLKEAIANAKAIAEMEDDEFEVPEVECREIAEASLKDFADVIGEARKDPEFKMYKSAPDLEDALLGIRRAQEVLDHLKFGITKRRPDFAIDLEAGGAEAEKCRILNRLEELANWPHLMESIEKEDPEFPAELLSAARDLAELKKDYKEGKSWTRFEIKPKVEEMVESLYAAGIREPYGLKHALSGLFEKERLRMRLPSAKPLGIRTMDYDTTRRYTLGDTIYLRMLDDKTQLTNEDVGPLIGEVTGVPTEQDPMLRVDIAGEIEQ